MEDFISLLKDADAVARFQKLCGIVCIEDADADRRVEADVKFCKLPVSIQHDHIKGCFDGATNGVIRTHREVAKGAICGEESDLNLRSQCAAQPLTASAKTQTDCSRTVKSHESLVTTKSEECMEKENYVIRNRFLYHLFHFGANLGNEIFYITFFPFWFWNIDGFVGRRLCIFWSIFMYIGQALKDIIKIPRPQSPPVIQLEKRYALEYGMPSTHAMVGTGIPFGIFFMTKERYNYPSELALIGAIAWSGLVCCSRVYLGMHSFLDVIAGVGLISALMYFCFPFLDAIDDFMLHSTYSPAICIMIPLFLCFFYPTLNKWSTARGDTTIIMAVSAGVGLGHWVCYQYGYMQKAATPPPYDIIPPTWSWAGLVVVRLAIGVVLLVTIRAAVKTVTFRLACRLNGCDWKSDEAHQKLAVELPYKFITYSIVAFNMVFLAPMVFRFLGIERETFFTEI